MLCLSNVKAKRKNKKRRGLPRVHGQRHSGKTVTKKRRFSSPSAWYKALGEEDFFLKKILPRVLHSGKRVFFKKRISSPSVALGEE
jgi:hypothetical protein